MGFPFVPVLVFGAGSFLLGTCFLLSYTLGLVLNVLISLSSALNFYFIIYSAWGFICLLVSETNSYAWM